MKRVMFVVGLGAGFVLGARAGRERYDQIVEVTKKVAQSDTAKRAGEFAQSRLDDASDSIARLTGTISEQSRELPTRLVHTTESLREDLKRRYEEIGESIDEVVERNRERFDDAVERNLEKQAQNLIAVGDLREQSLDDLATEHDEMIDEGHADERNLRE
ncbi:hypothetical protein EG850_00940 [Gulosibacter macacae]|uniref:YtxH domain-containing protein n=1 Tax=Gulosibacter macacae TaxID=2488791 RepID=A0A3P3W107_9MICO|nr:hypothetical protein [Gulosibacter macacae]RRJ88742.1 hypothetical protein EG850_00940 [Gulosibacter macacae]